MPLVTVTVSLLTEPIRTAEPPPLDWADRGAWIAFDVTQKTLVRGTMSAARTQLKYRDPEFHPTEAERAAFKRARAIADRFTGSAADGGLVPDLEAAAADAPADFYTRWLLGQAHAAAGDAEAAERAWTRAFLQAPAALVRRYTLPTTERAIGVPVETHRIGADEVVELEDAQGASYNTVRSEMVYVFPNLVTDVAGQIYLPVPKTILRLDQMDPKLDLARERNDDATAWFTFPGNVGRLPTTVAPVIPVEP